MKKLSIFLALALLLSCVVTPAFAAGWQENFEALGEENLPQGWTATTRGNAAITKEDRGIGLTAVTDEATAISILMVNSAAAALEESRYLIQLQAGIGAGSTFSELDYLDVALGSSGNSLLRWKALEGGIGVFALGQEEGSAITGESATYTIAIDPEVGTAAVYMDETQLYSGDLPSGYDSVDLSQAKLIFSNMARGESKANTLLLESVSMENAPQASVNSQPENGAQMVAVETIDSIRVDFGVKMRPETFQNVVLLEEGQSVEITIEQSGDAMTVVPVAGFQPQKHYELQLEQATDIFGTQLGAQSISFTTALAGYTPPTIQLSRPAADTEIFEGESVTLEAEVSSQQEIAYVEFYLNGEKAAQIQQEPYQSVLSSLTEGTYRVYARVVDETGGYANSQEVTITVRRNVPPTVTIDAFSAGDLPQISRDSLTEVLITAQDEDGDVAEVRVMWNGETMAQLKEAPYLVDLSTCPLGRGTIRVEATDNYGAVGVYEKEIIVVKQSEATLFESDFSSYTAVGNSGLQENGAADKQGYTKPGVIDEEHGTSLFLGSEVESNREDIGPNVVLMFSNATATYQVETDLYFPTEHTNFMLRFRNTANGTELKVLEFTNNNEIRLLGTGGAEDNITLRTFQRNTWYHLRAVVSGATRTYDLYLDDALLVRGRLGENGDQVAGLSQLRWSMYNYPIGEDQVEDGYIALDNIKVSVLTSLPYITGVSSELNGSEAAYDAESFYVKLSSGIAGDNLSSLVSLSCQLGQVPLASVSYDAQNRAVILTPQFPLSPGMDYTVTISKNVGLEGGGALGEDISAVFTTTGAELSLSGDFRSQGNQVLFEGEISNQTGEEKTVLLILNLWQDGALQQAFVTQETVAQGQTQAVQTQSVTLQEGQSLELHSVERLDAHSPVSVRTFTYTK